MSEEYTRVIDPIEDLLERLGVEMVFGEPTTEGNVTVIPVAEVSVGFGYGYGFGRGSSSGDEEEGVDSGEGGGGGGGAKGEATPRGYVRVTPDDVTFEPIIDETRIPVAGIAFAGWSVFWIAKTIRAFARRKK